MCDVRTIIEIKKRLKHLEFAMKIENIGMPVRFYDLEKERDFLLKFLAEVLTNSGQIKNFTEQLSKSKYAVQKAIRRFIREIEPLDTELYINLDKIIEFEKYTVSIKN